MVNNLNVSAYTGQVPTIINNGRNTIQRGPIYDKINVLEILNSGDNNTAIMTKTCRKKIEDLSFDIADVRNLIKDAINDGIYKKSEWCIVAERNDGSASLAACDSYVLKRNELIQDSFNTIPIEYYIKFAIGKTGKLLMLVSCHL